MPGWLKITKAIRFVFLLWVLRIMTGRDIILEIYMKQLFRHVTVTLCAAAVSAAGVAMSDYSLKKIF